MGVVKKLNKWVWYIIFVLKNMKKSKNHIENHCIFFSSFMKLLIAYGF